MLKYNLMFGASKDVVQILENTSSIAKPPSRSHDEHNPDYVMCLLKEI